MQTEESIPAGLTPERVGFFTDAVFAIAMTLLVIEIPRPDTGEEFTVSSHLSKAGAAGNLVKFLYEQAGSFIAYVLAFYILWVVWRQHHTLLDRIDRLSPRLVGLHFPLLLLIGFLPYPTTVFGHHTDNPAAALLYSLCVSGLLVCRSTVQSRALRDGLLRPGVDEVRVRAETRTSWVVTWYFVATTVLSWWTPWVMIAWFGASLLGSVLSHRRKAAG